MASVFAVACGLLFCGGYYLVARIVFPRDFAEWPDLDVYYAVHKRLIVGAVALLNLVEQGIEMKRDAADLVARRRQFGAG